MKARQGCISQFILFLLLLLVTFPAQALQQDCNDPLSQPLQPEQNLSTSEYETLSSDLQSPVMSTQKCQDPPPPSPLPGTPGTPTTSPNVSNNGALTVSWTAALGMITSGAGQAGYEIIEYKGGVQSRTLSTSPTVRSLSLTGYSNGDYTYRVRACNTDTYRMIIVCSSYSALSNETLVRRIPSTPTSIAGPTSVIKDGVATVTWGAASGSVTYYQTQRRQKNYESTLFGSWVTMNHALNRSRTFTGLGDGSWEFRVRACNTYGCSSWRSLTHLISVLHSPGIPASISASTYSSNNGSFSVSWGIASGNGLTYELEERHRPYGQIFQQYNRVYSGTSRSQSRTSRADGDWQYRVRACNTSGCSSYRTLESFVNTLYPPGAPVNLGVSPYPSTTGSYVVSWENGGGQVSHYRLYENDGSAINRGSNRDYSVTNRSDGAWSYRVDACNASGCSSKSIAVLANVEHPVPAAPSSIYIDTESNIIDNEVSWPLVAHADYYQAQSRFEGEAWGAVQQVTGLSTQFSAYQSGEYTYRVQACNVLPDESVKCGNFTESSIQVINVAEPWAQKGGDVADASGGYVDNQSHDATVGLMVGEAQVVGGSATYRVSIELPPGRAGMQPNVALTYSSRGGNGLVGVGWKLQAGSSISRCGAIYAIDGYNHLVNMTQHDRLCLDGSRLVAVSGSYGASGTEYRTEHEQFVKVVQSGHLDSGAVFNVYSKENRIRVYGGTINSRHVPTGQNAVLTWEISQETDYSGNNIRYEYSSLSDGAHLLSRIYYTGHQSIDGDRVVAFVYETRPDAMRRYIAGGRIFQSKRLKAIETYANGNQVRRYSLSYTASSFTKRSLVSAIAECTALNECKPATDFDVYMPMSGWDNFDSSTTGNRAVGVLGNVQGAARVEQNDLNGDGIPELIYLNPVYDGHKLISHTVEIYQQTGIADYHLVYDGAASGSPIVNGIYYLPQGDLNNDGITDFMVVEPNGQVKLFQFNQNMMPQALQTTNIMLPSDFVQNISAVRTTLQIHDLNGDGYQDISYIGSDNVVRYYLNNALGTNTFSGPNALMQLATNGSGASKRREQIVFKDINGDGVVDVVRTYQTSSLEELIQVSFGKVTQGQLTIDYTHSADNLNLPTNTIYHRHYWGDLNGDGLPDYIYPSTEGSSWSWFVRENQGDGTFALARSLGLAHGINQAPASESTQVARLQALWGGGLHIADIDSDGADELLLATHSDDDVCISFLGRSDTAGAFEFDQANVCNDAIHAVAATNTAYEDGRTFPIDWGHLDTRRFHWWVADFKQAAAGTVFDALSANPVVYAPINGFTLRDGTGAQGLQLKDIDNNGFLDFTYKVVTAYSERAVAANNEVLEVGGQNYTDASLTVRFESSSPAYASGYFEQRHNMALANTQGRLADTLYRVTDGLGAVFEWKYAPLSSQFVARPVGMPFYSVPQERYIDEFGEYFYFTSSMYVVQETEQDNGNGGANTTQYNYREAIYNRSGRGFQGFRTIIVDDLVRNSRAVSDFHQVFPLTGEVEAIRHCLISDRDPTCTQAPIETYAAWYDAIGVTDKSVWVYPFAREKRTFNLSQRTELLQSEVMTIGQANLNVLNPDRNVVDIYGNVLVQHYVTDDGFHRVRKTVSNQFQHDALGWWINRKTQQITSAQTLSRDTNVGAPIFAGTDPTLSLTTNYNYHTSHRKVSSTTRSANNLTHTQSRQFNAYGLVTELTESGEGASSSDLNRVTSYEYSSDGYFVTRETNDKGYPTLRVVEAKYGQVLTETGLNGVTTQYSYDGFGRLIGAHAPGTNPIEIGYQWCSYGCDIAGATYRVFQQQEGSATEWSYHDVLNRPIGNAVMGFDGRFIYQYRSYNDRGLVIFESSPSFDTDEILGTHYSQFDALGRAERKEADRENGQSSVTSYDYRGHVTTIEVNDGTTLYMDRTYNGQGQLVATTDAHGGVTRYAYNALGDPIAIQDANGQTIYAFYNSWRHKTQVVDPNMGTQLFVSNSFGEVTHQTDANGAVQTMAYDGLGRLLTRHVDGSLAASFVYDGNWLQARGQLVESRTYGTHDVRRTYDFDSLGRPEVSRVQVDTGTWYEVVSEYDARMGRLKALGYPSGIKVAYGYNQYGYRESVKNARSGFVYEQVTHRDVHLNPTATDKNNGELSETRSYSDVTGQLQNIHVQAGSGTVHELAYQYGAFSRLVQQEVRYHNGAEVTVESYQYDNLHRLVQSSRSFTESGVNDSPINYSYDATGNLLSKTDYALNYYYGDSSRSTRNAGPNAVHSVLKGSGSTATFTYDNNGNLLSGDGKSIVYNTDNKPIRIESPTAVSTLVYGADGMRVKQVNSSARGVETTLYIDKLEEVVANQSGSDYIIRSYIEDIAIITDHAPGTEGAHHSIAYTHRDRLGSVVTLSNADNTVIEHRSYDPFGKPRHGSLEANLPATLRGLLGGNNPITLRGFTDHEHLDDAQLIHMNGRVYDYNLGRFLSVDPFIQSPGNSQSFNPYSYIMNNPLAGTDPSGYVACAATDECGQKPKRKRESFSGGIVRNYIQVYRPAVNNGKAKSSSAKKTPDTSDVGSQQQVGGTNQKNGGALQARIKADAHNSIVRGGEDLGVEMGYGSYVNYGGVDAKWGDISLNENGHISSAEVLCDYSCQREAAEFGQITANDLSRAAMQISIRNSSRQAAVASGTVLAIPLVMVALPKVGTSTIVGLVKPFRKFGELPKAQKEACVGIALNLCGPGSPVDDLLKPKSPYTMPQPGPSKLAPAGGHIIHPRRFIDRSRASGVDG